MIDHVSVGVSDLAASAIFYGAILSVLGHRKLVEEESTVGFGKKYPEFWLNCREGLTAPKRDNGTHICLRAAGQNLVDEFFALAIKQGAEESGCPGLRPEYHENYYACFIKDMDGNHIEVVTFV